MDADGSFASESTLNRCIAEIACLKAVMKETGRIDRPLEQVLESVLEVLPSGWRRPGAVFCLEFEGRRFASRGFRKSDRSITAEFPAGQRAGSLTACYIDETPAAEAEPFLPQERELLESLTAHMASYIAERVMHRALQDSAERLQTIIDHAQAMVWIKDLDGRMLAANRRACEFLGKPLHQVIGHAVDKFVCEDIAAQYTKNDRLVLDSGERMEFEETSTHADGSNIYHSIKFPLRDADGRIYALGALATDITELKRREDALRLSEAFHRMILEDQTELIARFLADGTITFVNERYCRFFGKNRESLLGNVWQPLVVAEDLPGVEALVASLTPESPVILIENRVYDGDGQVRWMEFINRAFYRDDGSLAELQAVGRDITDRHHFEEQLKVLTARVQAAREEERIKIAREIHDVLAQQLTRLKLDISWLQRRMEKTGVPDPELADRASEMTGMVDAAITTVQKIATELRPIVLDTLGLPAAVEWQVREFQTRTGIECDVVVPEDEFVLDRERATAVFRILQESLTNISRHAYATRVEVLLQCEPEDLMLSVRDNGRGIAREVVDSSSGIGLAGMRERAQLLNGNFRIAARQSGAGTEVEVHIPLPRSGGNAKC
jgi:PAS domain S-box-containing protein